MRLFAVSTAATCLYTESCFSPATLKYFMKSKYRVCISRLCDCLPAVPGPRLRYAVLARPVLTGFWLYTVSQKSEPPKHFATATANLHRFKWTFTHTRRHLFLSSTSNFIRIPYSVYEMFNSFKLLSQISVTDTTYFLLTLSVVTAVTSVCVDKQTTCYQKRIEFW